MFKRLVKTVCNVKRRIHTHAFDLYGTHNEGSNEIEIDSVVNVTSALHDIASCYRVDI